MKSINCIGALNIDLQGFSDELILHGDCNAGVIESSPGGVAGNIAEVLARLGAPVRLVSAVGQDAFGDGLVQHAGQLGIDTAAILRREDQATSTYLNIVDADGQFVFGISDMKTIEAIEPHEVQVTPADYLVLDACLNEQTLEHVVQRAEKIYLDPVSAGKTKKIKPLLRYLHGLKLNALEALALTGKADMEAASSHLLYEGVKEVIITLGDEGIYYRDQAEEIRLPALQAKVVNPSGAGDSFFGGYLAMRARHYPSEVCLRVGLICATMSVVCKQTVSPEISWENIKSQYQIHFKELL